MDATGKQYKYIFAMVDSFTKFIWLFPMKTKSCEETLKKLRIWSEIFGNPVRIVSDRGSAFTANSFAEHMKENGIEHVWSTTGVPRGNGQVESVNRTVYLNFDEQRQQLRKDAKIEIQPAQESYKKNFDLKRKPEVDYKVGDLVAIRRTQFVAGKKLGGEYMGPYEVSSVKRNGRYEVRKAGDFEGPSNTFTSCDYMKLWRYVQDNADDWSSGTDD